MTENNRRVLRIVQCCGLFGVMPSRLAADAGVNYSGLRDILGGQTEPRDGTVAVLRDTLRELVEVRFRALAEIAVIEKPDAEILRAVTPAAVRLADVLQRFLSEVEAAGWPRRLTPQEIAERMAGHDAELERIQAEEEEVRRSVECVAWGEPSTAPCLPAPAPKRAAKKTAKKTARKRGPKK